jgi:hypothetical protein
LIVANANVGARLWAVVLTGIPYGVFKIGAGLAAYEDVAPAVGIAFIAWGVVDILLNLASVPWGRQVSHCLLSNIGRRLDRRRGAGGHEQLYLAIDTLLSFAIVATMIWFNRVGALPELVVRAWELSVIATVLGAGVERVWRSARQQRVATTG